MNNEPVAWIAYDEFGDFMLEATPEGDYPWQPLYTHPAKTLTDELKALLYSVNGDCYLGKEKEEALVAQVRKQYTKPAKTLTDEEILQEAENMFGTYFFESIDDPYWIEFARAILRKAQEK